MWSTPQVPLNSCTWIFPPHPHPPPRHLFPPTSFLQNLTLHHFFASFFIFFSSIHCFNCFLFFFSPPTPLFLVPFLDNFPRALCLFYYPFFHVAPGAFFLLFPHRDLFSTFGTQTGPTSGPPPFPPYLRFLDFFFFLELLANFPLVPNLRLFVFGPAFTILPCFFLFCIFFFFLYPCEPPFPSL